MQAVHLNIQKVSPHDYPPQVLARKISKRDFQSVVIPIQKSINEENTRFLRFLGFCGIFALLGILVAIGALVASIFDYSLVVIILVGSMIVLSLFWISCFLFAFGCLLYSQYDTYKDVEKFLEEKTEQTFALNGVQLQLKSTNNADFLRIITAP